jgi:hypothetical protein
VSHDGHHLSVGEMAVLPCPVRDGADDVGPLAETAGDSSFQHGLEQGCRATSVQEARSPGGTKEPGFVRICSCATGCGRVDQFGRSELPQTSPCIVCITAGTKRGSRAALSSLLSQRAIEYGIPLKRH